MSQVSIMVPREKWRKKFGEWFRHVLMDAKIYDYRYPIKGCGVWLPYGFKIRKNTFQVLRDLLDMAGHEEALFPLLIPETSLAKESVHVKSFENECFWVTHGGLKPLQIKHVLRPTSETAIAPMLKLWIRSHADLPLKFYQVVNVFRCETKATRPLIRVREVSTFKEAHTAHATLEEAEKQVEEEIEIYKKFFDEIAVPYLITKRPEWDKFAGAVYTISFDTIMPDGRTLQIGTVHNLGQNFSKAFDVTYETKSGEREHVWQTCAGISERAIAALLSVNGDDHGAVLPPKIAPIQVIIIPIPYKGKEEERINKTCEEVNSKLKTSNIRAEVDLRPDVTPGSKFYDWELRGVPIRIEIGPRDIQKNQVTIVRRDTLERHVCDMNNAKSMVQAFMKKMISEMRTKNWQWLRENTHKVKSLEEAKQLLQKKRGVLEALWCGNNDCGQTLGLELNASVLGSAVDIKERIRGSCIICNKKASQVARIARTY